MIRFYSIQSFQESLDIYCKRDDFGYKNCKEDICNFFINKNIETIFNHPILIAPSNNCRLIKSRFKNSNYNKGASGGFRLYYYVEIHSKSVYFIGFYPKTGKYGREDLTDTEIKILITKFAKEKKEGNLLEHDITDNLSLITATK